MRDIGGEMSLFMYSFHPDVVIVFVVVVFFIGVLPLTNIRNTICETVFIIYFVISSLYIRKVIPSYKDASLIFTGFESYIT